jgi:hypothetical protein
LMRLGPAMMADPGWRDRAVMRRSHPRVTPVGAAATLLRRGPGPMKRGDRRRRRTVGRIEDGGGKGGDPARAHWAGRDRTGRETGARSALAMGRTRVLFRNTPLRRLVTPSRPPTLNQLCRGHVKQIDTTVAQWGPNHRKLSKQKITAIPRHAQVYQNIYTTGKDEKCLAIFIYRSPHIILIGIR